jgi:hypothetical protein
MDATWQRYRQASRAGKTKILNEVCAATGYHRKYAIAKIRKLEACRPPQAHARRRREARYGRVVLTVVEKVWVEAGYPWSVRLKVILKLWWPWIRKRFRLNRAQAAALHRISARTIDRALQNKKRDRRRRLYGRTKPGVLLRHRIPIQCESWAVQKPGYLELDTVSHSGDNASGLFASSLNLTDIGSTWVETRAVLGKGEAAILDAFRQISQVLPFPVAAIDADNGGEFINHRLWRHCEEQKIGFTRSRPYKKDDNAHIEQKNWTHVRRLIGWDRYDTPQAVRALNDLYAHELRLYLNLFQPSVKLIRVERRGSRRTRRYDAPQTPLDRLTQMPGTDPHILRNLLELRTRLDPFALSAVIRKKLNRIWSLKAPRGQTIVRRTRPDSSSEIAQVLSRSFGANIPYPKSIPPPSEASLG